MRLSRNFTLNEFLVSQTAERSGGEMQEMQSNPSSDVVRNLQYLTNKSLQPIRTLLKTSLTVSSGYRCELLNTQIGGSKTSQHMVGEAADLSLSSEFLHRTSRQRIKHIIREKIRHETGAYPSDKANANFYLFACICLYLDELDVDQVIHEYGDDGSPKWVHISCSRSEKNKRQILIKRQGEGYIQLDKNQALKLGCD